MATATLHLVADLSPCGGSSMPVHRSGSGAFFGVSRCGMAEGVSSPGPYVTPGLCLTGETFCPSGGAGLSPLGWSRGRWKEGK